MLCWIFYISFFILVCFISFLWINKSFLHLLLVTECIIILIFLLALVISSIFNIISLINIALILLILGGLELALAFLLLNF